MFAFLLFGVFRGTLIRPQFATSLWVLAQRVPSFFLTFCVIYRFTNETFFDIIEILEFEYNIRVYGCVFVLHNAGDLYGLQVVIPLPVENIFLLDRFPIICTFPISI